MINFHNIFFFLLIRKICRIGYHSDTTYFFNYFLGEIGNYLDYISVTDFIFYNWINTKNNHVGCIGQRCDIKSCQRWFDPIRGPSGVWANLISRHIWDVDIMRV